MAISSLLEDSVKPETEVVRKKPIERAQNTKQSKAANLTLKPKIKPAPTEAEDSSFDLTNSLHMETAYQNSNFAQFSQEKSEFENVVESRLGRSNTTEDYKRLQKVNEFLENKMKVAQGRAEILKRNASKELYPQALAKVMKREELAAKREKKRLRLQLQREKRAQKAAAAAAAAAAANANAPSSSNGKVTGKQKKARTIKPRPNGGPGSKVKNQKVPAVKTGVKRNQIVTPTPETPKAKKETVKKEVVKKEIIKAPSVKDVRAVARLYQNTYDGIWREMARKDAGRIYRMMHSSVNVRQSNAKKTSQLAAKEARRWQYKTNKSIKDLQNKARRSMREMLLFWKRNEREERELRKKAEKDLQELQKREEEVRESQRQARKLNFLLSQTELYTHFIGKKIDTGPSTNEPERNVEELDFDEADDSELEQAAMANARKAFEKNQEHARQFDGDSTNEVKKIDIDSDEMNFQNPTSLGEITIPQPKMLSCTLKEYQIKGLNWLANLYEQGINGILADEMGLGKTVQSISVMAYLAETHNIWGPFLVVTPASTLHNWQQEIAKFVPSFKVIPYWGNAKDRKVLRKFWDYKNVKYNRDSEFHVLVTSYQMVVADAAYFQKMRWQYMILDEAQAIKSSSSSRWKSLLSFQCRNRLLLTGTPIQNSMQELWALLHFIMPSLFDSHDEFSDWFSKDIESHAQSNTQLNEQQLSRLHMILKPFMLRRLKKHVQSELGDKIEEDVYCDLTSRQRLMYKTLRSQISLMDLIEKAASGSDEGTQSLMNLVMQFRKVCNHPDLFERADVKSAFNFSSSGIAFGPVRDGSEIELYYTAKNLISFNIPKMLYREGGFLDVVSEESPAGFKSKYLNSMLNIWSPENIIKNKTFSWARLIDKSHSDLSYEGRHGPFERAVKQFSYTEKKTASVFPIVYDEDGESFIPGSNFFLISEQNSIKSKATSTSTGILDKLLNVGSQILENGIYNTIDPAFGDPVSCPPIILNGSDRSITLDQELTLFDPKVKSALFPMTLDKEWDYIQKDVHIKDFPASNMFPWARNLKMGFNTLRMPSMSKFVTDSGKLSKLDQMLPVLKANDHRILIYFQMTKMMDLMEEYLTFRQYKYVRLDGSSKLSDRRDLVNDWQTKPELFIFLLSTRAGGLGINLTAADTVIFYDSDWNPTIDSQAMDRAHRMGQTRQVTVYRLLVKGTIEERMRDRAKQKMHVQQVVMEGGASTKSNDVDLQKPGREVAYWLLDDDATADAMIKKKQEESANAKGKGKRATSTKDVEIPVKKRKTSYDEMYHEGEGNFDESSQATTPAPSGTNTPNSRAKKKTIASQKQGH